MKVILSALCVVTASAGCPASLSQGEHNRTVTVGGREREYHVFVPKDMPATPSPGLIMLHGCGSSPEKFMRESGMVERADAKKWYNVWPKGTTTRTSLGWNAGPGAQCQTGGLVNDVDFMKAMVADLKENLCLDQGRIFAAGFSNGGQMTYNLTCEMPDVFAGFSVTAMRQQAATYPANCGLPLSKIRPMMSVCGLSDSACNSNYGSWTKDYASWSGCKEGPTSVTVSSTTGEEKYGQCGGGASQPFDAYSISGLGHCWSGNNCCDGQCLNQNPANMDTSTTLLSFFDGLSSTLAV